MKELTVGTVFRRNKLIVFDVLSGLKMADLSFWLNGCIQFYDDDNQSKNYTNYLRFQLETTNMCGRSCKYFSFDQLQKLWP